MTLAGYLSEYSLAEVFNFVHQGNRTGLLSISPVYDDTVITTTSHYLWFEGGRIVGVTSDLDGQGLLRTIEQRKLFPQRQIEQLRLQLDNLPQPIGLYLKSRGLLDAEQLKLLFNAQVIAPTCKLFELRNGKFNFDPDKLPNNTEITGISLPAQEMGLLGLRMLKDWSGLSAKLPDPDYALQRLSSKPPIFRLDRHESELLKLADGETRLNNLAEKMGISIEVATHISFRLSSFGLIQEIPTEPLQPALDPELAVPVLINDGQAVPAVSKSFLGNLRSFLKKGSEKSQKTLVK
jgi:Domain of unknown function (DUF4388)